MKKNTRYLTLASTLLILPIAIDHSIGKVPIPYIQEVYILTAWALCVVIAIQLCFKKADSRLARDTYLLLAGLMLYNNLAQGLEAHLITLFIPYAAWLSYRLHQERDEYPQATNN